MIRRATPGDAAAVADVHARARAGWPFVDTIATQTGEAVWAARLGGAEADTWVLERGGALAAFASVCPVDDEDLAGQPIGEVLALYVHPEAQGAGGGAALLAFAEADRRDRGDEAMVLWVFAANAGARRFYERHGYVLDRADGEALRYRRPL